MSAAAFDDRRTPCVLFLTCVGAGPKYFLQLSDDFRRRYRLIPYMFNDIKLLPDLLPLVEEELEREPLLIYHDPDCLPYLGQYRERYDQFVERIPAEVTRISIPQPGFSPFWPFHCGDPRNADADRPHNRFGQLPVYPYGDTYVLRLLKEGVPPEEVVERYLAVDLSTSVDLDRLLLSAVTMLERQDRIGPVKVADYVAETFRSQMLFQTVNHANNRLFLYVTNQVLRLLDCTPVREPLLNTITEIVERPMPVHPSLARYYGASYLNEHTRYPIDDIRNPTFAEYIRDYVYFASGLYNYHDRLANYPAVRLSTAADQPPIEADPVAINTASSSEAGGPDEDGQLPETLDGSAASAEDVAYLLFRHIASVEGQSLDPFDKREPSQPVPDRGWILDTYAQCLAVVRNPRSSREAIASNLLRHIADVERRALGDDELREVQTPATRAWILQTYAECLAAVLNDRRPASPSQAVAGPAAEAQPVPPPHATAPRLTAGRSAQPLTGVEADFQTAPIADIIDTFMQNGSVLLRNFADRARLLELRRLLDELYGLRERGHSDIIDFVFRSKHRQLVDALFGGGKYEHRALAGQMQALGSEQVTEPWQHPLSPHIDAFFRPLNFTVNFWVPLQPCGGDAPSLGVVRTPFAHVLDYVGYRDEGPIDLPAPELNFARFNTSSRQLFEGDAAAVEAFRTRFAGCIDAPHYELGDAMMLSNWTLHFTQSRPGMTDRRENVEIRLMGPATLQQVLKRHAKAPSATPQK